MEAGGGHQGRDRIQSPSYPTYSPSVAHPTAQQPPFDPFFSRDKDPFRPATSPSRRDSHGHRTSEGSNDPPRTQEMPQDTLQPAPPPPPSPFHSTPYSSFSGNRARRSSIGGGFSGGSQDRQPPPPPPPSFLSRQMPPPGSPTQPQYANPAARTSMNSPSAFGANRDTNGGSTHRSAGSMSIQSIMGSDTAPPVRSSTWSSYGAGSTSAASPSQVPSSPHRDGVYNVKRESEPAPDPRTPDRKFGGSWGLQPTVKSPTAQTREVSTSSDHDRRGFSHLLHSSDQKPSGSSNPPQRPFSQPAASERQGAVYNSAPGSADPAYETHAMTDRMGRDRAFSDLDGRRNSHVLPDSSAPPPGVARENANGYDAYGRDAWASPRHSVNESNTNTQSYGPHRMSGSARDGRTSSAQFGPVGIPPDPHSHRDTFPERQPSPYHMQQNGHGNGVPPPDDRLPGSFRPRTPVIDSNLRRSLEDTHASHRSFLGIANDSIKRSGRASPLPQAVQGAQGQPVGSGRDPTIKTEFGRMFSGLGSGVGSTPQPPAQSILGPPTSNRQSPVEDDAEAELGRGEPVNSEVSKAITSLNARNGRGNKRTYEDHVRSDGDMIDGRLSPSVGAGRGGKRGRTNQSAVPHHHHPLAHHHHHHRRRPGDEAANSTATTPARRSNNSPFGTLKINSTPNTTSSPVPHHHHHHHAPHHHHHVPKASPTVQPFRRPVTTIRTQPLVKSVAHLPRRHLGSQLYSPKFTLPSSTSTMVDSKRTYTINPNPIPRFEERENCTFTVRVPRYYLSKRLREEICAARNVWGTDIYTDDSDPIAAAVHSGWIRGMWGNDVDDTLLELSASSSGPGDRTSPTKDISTTTVAPSSDVITTSTTSLAPLTTPPLDGPVEPPPNADMHLTLLILPTLEKYTGSVWHGVRSRAWGANHDGPSFKVERVEWVDERAARYDERGGAARRKRLREAMAATLRARARPVNGVVQKVKPVLGMTSTGAA